MGFVGFIDDYLKIVKKIPKGLIARYKLIAQILIGIFVSFVILNYVDNPKIFIDAKNNIMHRRCILCSCS